MPKLPVQHALAVALCCATTAAVAQSTTFTLKPLRINGNTNLSATSINVKNTIVGALFDATTGAQSAFEMSHGQLSTLPNPGGAFGPFVPEVINDVGDVLGYAKNSGVGNTAMFLLQSGAFNTAYEQPLVEPGDAQSDTPLPIALTNNAKVSFNVIYSISGPIGTNYGRPPNFHSVPPQNHYTHVNSINKTSIVAGTDYSFNGISAVYYGFGKKFTAITPPNAASTTGGYINDAGTVAGSFRDTSGGWHGFTYASGTITTFDMPQTATRVTTNAINAHGRVVGVFSDSTGAQHAFLWNGTTASAFGNYGASDTIAVAIGARGGIVVSRQIAGSTPTYQSYLVTCRGTGC